MDRRFRRTLASALVLSAVPFAASVAYAGPKDAAATKLDNSAMNDDFLAVKFDKAEEKLRKALKECGDKGCDPKLKAQIHMHLGIILVNAGKADAAVTAFSDGLKVSPDASPDKDFVTPDVQKAFDEAKGKGAPKDEPKDTPPKDTEKPPAPSSDLKHEHITESPVNTPIPVYVGNEPSAAKFILNYKPFGGGEWTKVEMRKMGKGWGAEIPCKDTNTTGTLKYYVVAQDAGGDSIASAGSKKQPYEIAIKNKVSGEAPSFPGKDPPAACKGKDACPPGINEPGCEPAALAYGAKCTGPGQCNKADGLACVEGTCQPGEETGEEGGTTEGGEPAKKNWLSLSLSLDDALVSGGEVCSPDNYSNGTFACFRSDGKLYKPAGANDKGTVSGPPFAVGTVRILAGYDRIIAGNFALGTRLGFAFNGGPAVPSSSGDKKFFPFHAELRGTYWIGKDVLTKTGVRPFVFLGGGAAQVDAKIAGVPVSDDCDLQQLCVSSRTPRSATDPANFTQNGTPIASLQAKGTKKINVDAYRKMGTSFVGLGGGIMYAINKRAGLTLDLKIAYFFGSSGIAVSPTLGGVYGF